jgi:hypothetical protein
MTKYIKISHFMRVDELYIVISEVITAQTALCWPIPVGLIGGIDRSFWPTMVGVIGSD